MVEDVVVELARIGSCQLIGSGVARVLYVDDCELLAESVRVCVKGAERAVCHRTSWRHTDCKLCATGASKVICISLIGCSDHLSALWAWSISDDASRRCACSRECAAVGRTEGTGSATTPGNGHGRSDRCARRGIRDCGLTCS